MIVELWLRAVDWIGRRHVTFFLAGFALVLLVTLYGC